jgi:hypothetical protein
MKKVRIISKPSLMDKFFIKKKRETERLAAEKKPIKPRKVNLLAIQRRIAAILKETKHALQASK